MTYLRLFLGASVLLSALACEELGDPSVPNPVAPTATITLLQILGAESIQEGQSARYSLSTVFSTGTEVRSETEGVQWSSSNQGVADFDTGTSQLAALRPGTTTITATFGGRTTTKVVIVTAAPIAAPPPQPTPTTPTPPPTQPSPEFLSSANGPWTINSVTSDADNQCTGFSFQFTGDVEISGVGADGTGGRATLRRNGASSPTTVDVTVTQAGAFYVLKFSADLIFNGNVYRYAMEWRVQSFRPGAQYSGGQGLEGATCRNVSQVSGAKR
jgi:hypothetical protein